MRPAAVVAAGPASVAAATELSLPEGAAQPASEPCFTRRRPQSLPPVNWDAGSADPAPLSAPGDAAGAWTVFDGPSSAADDPDQALSLYQPPSPHPAHRLGRCALQWPDRVQAQRPRPAPPAAVSAVAFNEPPQRSAHGPRSTPFPHEDGCVQDVARLLPPRAPLALLRLPPPPLRGPQDAPEPLGRPPR